jgi:mercuric ion transport protein
MNDRNMLRTGIIGSAIAAICCFTPALVVLVTAIGLSAVIGFLDYLLFPALAGFVGMTGYALYLRSKGSARDEGEAP